MSLVKVPARGDFLVGFPQGDGTFRVTFKRDGCRVVERQKRKYLVHHADDERVLIKREIFSRSRFREAIFAERFDIHNFKVLSFGFRVLCSMGEKTKNTSKFAAHLVP